MPTNAIATRKIKKYGWTPDLPDHRDHVYAAARPAANLPDKVSLRAKMPPVFDQGELGSCTANALCGAMGFIHPGFIGSRLQLYFSERKVEHSVDQDSGAQLRDGVKVLNQLGVAPETLWPYDITKFTDTPPANVFKAAAEHKVNTYKRLAGRNDYRSCLAAGFPFVIGITVYESFESESVAKDGIVPMPSRDDQMVGGHAVCVIGYDSHLKLGANGVGDYYEVRNSWGSKWGDEGNFWLPAAYVESADLAADAWTLRA